MGKSNHGNTYTYISSFFHIIAHNLMDSRRGWSVLSAQKYQSIAFGSLLHRCFTVASLTQSCSTCRYPKAIYQHFISCRGVPAGAERLCPVVPRRKSEGV